MDCRRMQDRATDLLLLVNKNHAGARTAVRNLKAQITILEGEEDNLTVGGSNNETVMEGLRNSKQEMLIYEAQDDELRFLGEVVRSKQSNLKMTSSDIRLLCAVVNDQIRLGEIQPGNRRGSPVEPKPEPAKQPEEPVKIETNPINETVPLTVEKEPGPIDPGNGTPVLQSIAEFLESEADS